ARPPRGRLRGFAKALDRLRFTGWNEVRVRVSLGILLATAITSLQDRLPLSGAGVWLALCFKGYGPGVVCLGPGGRLFLHHTRRRWDDVETLRVGRWSAGGRGRTTPAAGERGPAPRSLRPQPRQLRRLRRLRRLWVCGLRRLPHG